MVQWIVGSILHGVDLLGYFAFQPVLHNWCNKGSRLCFPVWWDGAYERTLAANRKEQPMWRQWVSSLTIWVVFYHITGNKNVLSVSLIKHFLPSYFLKKGQLPPSVHCQCILAIHHISVECRRFAQTRTREMVESFRFHCKLTSLESEQTRLKRMLFNGTRQYCLVPLNSILFNLICFDSFQNASSLTCFRSCKS